MLSDDPLHTVQETMALLHISRATLYRLVAEKKLRITKIRNRSLFRESEIERYLRTAQKGKAA